jgi:predicted ester cyclase
MLFGKQCPTRATRILVPAISQTPRPSRVVALGYLLDPPAAVASRVHDLTGRLTLREQPDDLVVGALDGVFGLAVAVFELFGLKMFFESYLLRHNAIFYNRIQYHTARRGKRAGKEEKSVSIEENKALSNRVAQAIGKGELDVLDELMAPELAEEFKRDVAKIRRAFPDYAGTNVEQIAEGEKVANRFVFLGTHLGEFEGVTPTGKRVEFVGHSIDRVVEGKIVESWVEVDMLGVMEQLGVVPEPGQSEEATPT